MSAQYAVLLDSRPFVLPTNRGPMGRTGNTGPAGDVAKATDRTAMAAIVGQAAGSARFLVESGRKGLFVWDSANHSAHVTADVAQGIYVAPTSDTTGASGAWVRSFDGPINPGWFGLTEGDVAGNGAGNSTAMTRLLATAVALNNFHIQMPTGTYWFGSTIDINIGNMLFKGSVGGGNSSTTSVKSILKFPTGVTGLRLQGAQTNGALGKDAVAHNDARGTVIRDLVIQGAFVTSGVEAEAHGIQLRTMGSIENVTIENFEGDGIHIAASLFSADGADPPYGNASNCHIANVTCLNNRDGIFLNGTDANAIAIIRPVCFANRRWGIQDLSEFGCTVVNAVLTANGITAANNGTTIGASQVSSAGNIYTAIAGQEAGASTNAPSGTTADNTWWHYMFAGAPQTGRPAWTSGIAVRAGGAVHDTSTVGASLYLGCYAEGDQGHAQIVSPSMVDGGLLAGWVFNNTVPRVRAGLNAAATGPAIVAAPVLSVASGVVTAELGDVGGNVGNRIIAMNHPTLGQQSIGYSTGLGNILFGRANGVATYFQITTTGTSSTFGRSAAVTDAFNPLKLFVTDDAQSFSNGRCITIDTAAPSTGPHAQGDISFRRTGTPTDPFASRCITSGTPGTWQDIYGGLGTNPIGYVTGAGGAVTQATSKSTGVTLNKLCGQITMNAAALAANTGVAFTVTNSQVAATDTIDLVLSSGNATAGTYNYQVDKVSAGSFVVWVKNISAGSLSEALVFNFSIKKAVNA